MPKYQVSSVKTIRYSKIVEAKDWKEAIEEADSNHDVWSEDEENTELEAVKI